MTNNNTVEFKKGDRVKVVYSRSTVSDIAADLIGSVADGDCSYEAAEAINAAIEGGLPFYIVEVVVDKFDKLTLYGVALKKNALAHFLLGSDELESYVGTDSQARVSHTPGPWHVTDQCESLEAGIKSNWLSVFGEDEHKQECSELIGDACVICIVAPPHRTTDIDRANARLIAAAPALLEACKMALKLDSVSPGSTAIYNSIRDAICLAVDEVVKAPVTRPATAESME